MSRATASGVPPSRAMRSTCASSSAGGLPPSLRTQPAIASAAPLRSTTPSKSTPLMRVCAVNGTKPGVVPAPQLVLADARTAWRARRSSGPPASRRRASDSCAASARSASATPGIGTNSDGLAVAERDRAGLVEQQDVDVAGGLDRAARQREDVAAHEAVHAGDADRAQQRADRRRDERDEQRDERRDRDRRRRRSRANGCSVTTTMTKMSVSAGEQDAQRDLVRRLAPLGALDERDHPIQERLPGLLRDLDDDAVARARACRR